MRRLQLIVAFSIVLLINHTKILESQTSSRIEDVQAQRRKKEGQLNPAQPDRLERALVRLQDVADAVTASPSGLRLKFSSDAPGWDGLVPGSGFTLGGEYFRPDIADGEIHFRTSAVGTFKKSYLLDAQLTFPRLSNNRLALDFFSRYKAERAIEFYGSGPDSEKDNRTNYSRETMEADAALHWRPARHFAAGVTAAALWFNVGPGTTKDIASTEQVFGPAEAPGIHRQTDFVRGGVYVSFDSRINPSIPLRGTQLMVGFDHYADVHHAGFTFGLLKTHAQHSFTFFNEKRVVTIRADAAMSRTRGDNVVPVYLQQTLGGPEDLRGFRILRFSDRNKLTANAEYRWEVAHPLDMAIFADTGKVFSDSEGLNLDRMEASGGLGLRFKTRTAVALRLDLAFSREGAHLWFRFSDLF